MNIAHASHWLRKHFRTALKPRKDDWLTSLPVILLALRTIPNENHISPFTALTGSTLLSPCLYFNRDSLGSKSQYEYVQNLAKHMSQIDFTSLSSGLNNTKLSTYIPKT